VAEISGIDAFDVVHVNCCQVVIVLKCFLPRNDNKGPSPIHNHNNGPSLHDNRHSCVHSRYQYSLNWLTTDRRMDEKNAAARQKIKLLEQQLPQTVLLKIMTAKLKTKICCQSSATSNIGGHNSNIWS